jgi:hypothetical protein
METYPNRGQEYFVYNTAAVQQKLTVKFSTTESGELPCSSLLIPGHGSLNEVVARRILTHVG